MFLFKYEKELDQCKVLDYEQSCYFKTIIGVGQIWYHDGLHVDMIRDRLICLSEDGNFQDVLWLEQGWIRNILISRWG